MASRRSTWCGCCPPRSAHWTLAAHWWRWVTTIDAKIYPGLHIGTGCTLGPYSLIGFPRDREAPGARETWLGDGATIRSHAVLYAGSRIGVGFHAGHGALVRHDCVIGDNVSIGSRAEIGFGCTIGDHVRVHSAAFIAEGSRLGARSWVGPGAILTNSRYPSSRDGKYLEPVTLGVGVIVGAGAVILPGVTIGDGAVIGAGAIVARAVLPGAVVHGDAARVVKQREALSAYAD